MPRSMACAAIRFLEVQLTRRRAICPGWIDTPPVAGWMKRNKEVAQAIIKQTPRGTIEAVLAGIDQQTEDQAGDGGDQSAAQPHDVLRMSVEMTVGQQAAEQHARQGAADQQGANDQRGGRC